MCCKELQLEDEKRQLPIPDLPVEVLSISTLSSLVPCQNTEAYHFLVVNVTLYLIYVLNVLWLRTST